MLSLGNLDLGLLVSFFLGLCDTIELVGHLFDLLSLRMVDVGLTRDVLVTFFDLGLSVFVLLSHIPLRLLRLGELDLNVAE